MIEKLHRPRRSVLYVPASNARALAKAPTIDCDAVIFDLEDAVAPGDKSGAREALRVHFRDHPACAKERVIRINALSTEWGAEDLLAARGCRPDAILLPKVGTPQDVLDAADALEQTDATPDRQWLVPPLMQIVLAGRAGSLAVLDGVSNQFNDLDAFAAECRQGAAMGFDGKTLIHPAQIAPCEAAFSPSHAEIGEAQAIRAAFALPHNAGRGVIQVDGRMVERLHLEQAERLLARAGLS